MSNINDIIPESMASSDGKVIPAKHNEKGMVKSSDTQIIMFSILKEIKKRYARKKQKPDLFETILKANSDIPKIGLFPMLVKKHMGLTAEEFLINEGVLQKAKPDTSVSATKDTYYLETSEERMDRALKLFDLIVKSIEEQMRKDDTYSSVPLASGHVKGSRRKDCDIAEAEMFIKQLDYHLCKQDTGYDWYYINPDDNYNEITRTLKKAYKQIMSDSNASMYKCYFDGSAWLRVTVAMVVICKVFLCTTCDSEVIFYRDKWDYRGDHSHSGHVEFVLSHKYADGHVSYSRS